MMENRIILDGSELDGFDKVNDIDHHQMACFNIIIYSFSLKSVGCFWQRKLPSPGFQVEIVMIDYDGNLPARSKSDSSGNTSDGNAGSIVRVEANKKQQSSQSEDNDDVFSDSDGEEKGGDRKPVRESNATPEQVGNLAQATEQMVLGSTRHSQDNSVSQEATSDRTKKPDTSNENEALAKLDSTGASDIKAMAADASVFTFGDDEDFESE